VEGVKLAFIEHDRCGEWAASTYVWVEASMHSDDLEGLVEAAKKCYLDAEEAFKKDPDCPPLPNWQNKYSRWPDKTVKEAEFLFEAQEKLRKAWEKKRDSARRSFAEHLVAVSGGKVQLFYDVEIPLRVTCSWGHRHGTTIDMGETKPNAKDLNAYQEQD
jgi:hypothetical protein